MKIFKRGINDKTVYGILMVCFLWYMLHITIKSNVIPGPYETVKRFIALLPGVLSMHLLASFGRIAAAIAVSMLLGVPLGLWIGMNNRGDAIISPIVYILYPLPKIAFLPIFMILLGIEDLSKITLIVTIIIFQILIAVRDGVKEIPKELFYSVSSLGVSGVGIYRHLIMPAVMPKLISGLRISLGISISTLFFAENFATTYGIGYYIMNAWTMVDYLDMFSGILGLSLLGLFLLTALDIVERKLCPWIFL
ncbi:ABC transporter permease [Lutispora saccharofermentans]|uniref:ABC transporter permease n=1 Tax=Lutispora saccharofermentans TaxID=3024236 RepID=A0ABT1NJX9_9FIRM|nr:ABC transporter permease [Lutispora saccharofermentans]MCQ1531578.1 ABC transporter permease [Lutispora saccharofermentans]